MEAAHGEAAHVEPAVHDMTKAELEAEVLKLEGELTNIHNEEAEAVEIGGLVLLLSVAFVMLIFYLVNSPSPVVRKQTWSLTCMSISIFAAVMMNSLVSEFSIASGASDGHPTILSEFIYLIVWWLASFTILYLDRDDPDRRVGYGTVFGHVLGFAAISAYGHLAVNEHFDENPGMTLVVIVIYLLTATLLALPVSFLGPFRKHAALHEQAVETCTDFFAMGLSFLIAMFFRGWIKFGRTGHAAGIHSDATGTQSSEVATLFFVGLLFLLVACLVSYVSHKTHCTTKGSTAHHAVHTLVIIAAMTSAWCWLEAANWVSMSKMAPNAGHGHHRRLGAHEIVKPEGVEGEEMGIFHMPQGLFMARLSVAAFFTLLFIPAVFLTTLLKKKSGHDVTRSLFKACMIAVSLVIGLAWEHLFQEAIQSVSDMATTQKAFNWLKLLFSFLLVILVLPAWMVYIVPKHNDELIEEYGGSVANLSICHAFGNCCDADEEEGGEDEYEEVEEEEYE